MEINRVRIFHILLICCFVNFLLFPVILQAKPKSLTYEYGQGESIFDIPTFEPGKVNLSISDRYKSVNVSKKPESSVKKPAQVKSSPSKNLKKSPKSLQTDYQKGFLVKKKIAPKQDNILKVNKIIIPYKPKYRSAGYNEVPKKKIRKPVVVIDPGHGGKDPGAIGKLGTQEKQITFLYSVSLKKELERSGKYKVILTRYGDKYVGLKSRVNKARKYGGDILISIHADSIADSSVRGFSVYTISDRRVKREAGKLLRKSDREEVIRGVDMRSESRDVKEAIIDFAQKETKSVSDGFSKIVAKHLGQKAKPLRRTNREASLAVLTGADIPSVLIELGYLSNKYEERLLRKKDHRRKIVTSIKSAIDEYFRKFDYFLE